MIDPARGRGASSQRTNDRPAEGPTILSVAAATLLLVSSMGVVGARTPGPRELLAALPSNLTVPAPTSNTSVLDLGMFLNASLNLSAVTGASNDSSNWHFDWLGLPQNCSSMDVSNYSCVPTATGTFSIQVKLTDNGTAATATSSPISITVNTDPVVTGFSVSSSSVTVGTAITFNVSASGGTAPLAYVYAGLPAGCSGNSSTLSCVVEAPQRYNTSVTVVDAVAMMSNTANLSVVVLPNSTGVAHPTLFEWGVIAGILVVGGIVSIALLLQARRVQRQAFGGRSPRDQAASPGIGTGPGADQPPDSMTGGR